MINLLEEAKNHIALYQFALSKQDWMPSAEERASGLLKAAWKADFRLPFPENKKNPEGLRRAMILVAGWCLYHKDPNLSFEETQGFLDEWYRQVMDLAAKGRPKKEGGSLRDFVTERRKDYGSLRDRFEHLDKINYYRLVCQAKANGPLREQEIIVPYEIIDIWKQNSLSEQERAICLLYHYYDDQGIAFETSKTDVSLWITGQSNWKVKPKENRPVLAYEGYGKGVQACLSIGSDSFRWKEGAGAGVALRDWPDMSKQLSDEALHEKRIAADPSYASSCQEKAKAYWINTVIANPEDMFSKYKTKNMVDLSAQNAVTGPKRACLRRFLLGLLYALSKVRLPHWENWEDLISELPRQTEPMDWMQVDVWALENYAVLSPLLEKSCSFFERQGKNRYYGKAKAVDGSICLFFKCKD